MNDIQRQKIKEVIGVLEELASDSQYHDVTDNIQNVIDNLNIITVHKDKVCETIEPDCYVYELFEFVRCDGGYALAKYNGFDEEQIFIPATYFNKPVVEISHRAFENCHEIKEVVLGNNIKIVKFNAFHGCKNLKKVVLNDGLSCIDASAFLGCESLYEIQLPNSLQSIGSSAFENTSITKIKIPPRITTISRSLFSCCKKLQLIILNENIKDIGDRAFEGCEVLEEINLPANIESIGDYAFLNCKTLKELKVLSTNVKIGERVFSKSRILQPDRRYNPTLYFSNLDTIEIKCLPGSTMQEYCRKNQIKCSRVI